MATFMKRFFNKERIYQAYQKRASSQNLCQSFQEKHVILANCGKNWNVVRSNFFFLLKEREFQMIFKSRLEPT
jgi:hypothetical protein